MNASEIKPDSILYWDEEPVKVKQVYCGEPFGWCVTIIRYAATDPKQNGFATVSSNCLTETPTNLTIIEISKVYRDERFAQPIQYELRCIGSNGIAQHISGQCDFPFEVPLLDSKIEEPFGLYSSRRK